MKFLFGKRNHDNTTKTVLFVCVQNAERSQMVAGIFREYAPKSYETSIAGTVPTSPINPIAVEVMKEVGIDISKQKPKDLTEDAGLVGAFEKQLDFDMFVSISGVHFS